MTMSDPTSVNPASAAAPVDFRDALEACRAEFSTIEEQDFQLINIDITARCTVILGHCEKLMGLCPQVRDELPKFDISSFETLEIKTKAALQAHFDHLLASAKPGEIPELDAKLTRFRTLFVSDINGLATRGLMDNSKLPDLKSASGHRNQAESVFALTAHLRRSWETIRTRTAVTIDELEEAEATAQSMLMALARKDASLIAPNEAARARRQAFTLFYRAYAQVRRAVLFVSPSATSKRSRPPSALSSARPVAKTVNSSESRRSSRRRGPRMRLTPAARIASGCLPTTRSVEAD
jgi:hypothetical protein